MHDATRLRRRCWLGVGEVSRYAVVDSLGDLGTTAIDAVGVGSWVACIIEHDNALTIHQVHGDHKPIRLSRMRHEQRFHHGSWHVALEQHA